MPSVRIDFILRIVSVNQVGDIIGDSKGRQTGALCDLCDRAQLKNSILLTLSSLIK